MCKNALRRPGRAPDLQQLARVEDARGVEQALDITHQAQFKGVLAMQEMVALELTDSVFCADAAPVAIDLVQHDIGYGRTVFGRPFPGSAGRARQVVMQVAVAEMAEDGRPHIAMRLDN